MTRKKEITENELHHHTIRLRLLKIAARVETGKTFVRFHLPVSCPVAGLFGRAAAMVATVRGA